MQGRKTRRDLKIGCNGAGVIDAKGTAFDLDTKFRMVKEAGVFDYYDRTPMPNEIGDYLRASEKHDLPIRAGGFYYLLGRDEDLMRWHLRLCPTIGTRAFNMQIMTHDADGKLVSDERIAETYLWVADLADRHGVTASFENHVNMWSEHLGRVERVGRMVEAQGMPFKITLDHSHVIFKIDNPREQDVQDMRGDVESGKLVLDPFKPGNVIARWVAANWVVHAHARAAIPNNPVNTKARHPDGSFGRGIQYPFFKPGPGEYHAEWNEQALEPWKEGLRILLRHHAANPKSGLGQVSTEFIPMTDYGAGAGYSVFEQNVACARWLHETWADITKTAQQPEPHPA